MTHGEFLKLIKESLYYWRVKVYKDCVELKYYMRGMDRDISVIVTKEYVRMSQHRQRYDEIIPIELKPEELEAINSIYTNYDDIIALTPNFNYNPFC